MNNIKNKLNKKIIYIGYLDYHKRNGFGIYKEKPNLKMIGYWKDNQIFNGH